LDNLTREQLLEIDYYLRLTRTLEERLVALFRQAKVIGGLYRSLGRVRARFQARRCRAAADPQHGSDPRGRREACGHHPSSSTCRTRT